MTSRQEEIKKGLFDVLNSCPKSECGNCDPDECIRCDVNRVLEYLVKENVVIRERKVYRDAGLLLFEVEPLIKKETAKQDD